ncbi:MAG TPA: YXWGXW repeat-containing protein [Pirellulales bacterium]|nr:YXWGXW repeat-containing protein [Pirellulales bacterium]
MRRRFPWALMAMAPVIGVLAFSCGLGGNVYCQGWLAVAAAADDSAAPAPGEMTNPALTPPLPVPTEENKAASSPAAGAEVLTQGPVHEAFAKPMELNPQPGPIVKKHPPDPIKEIPPAQQPDGDNIVWIPGYWAWADDRQDFIWVSGVWRAAPPGQTWVPGYWSEVDGGFQWTAGLWTATAKQEVSYLPAPPESLENGPSSPQPGENQFWIPGTWVYQNTNYEWQPGYWTVCRPNWVWMPAHYCWTPGGYVFVDGYWDYELARRGCLFAPVYFAQPVYMQPAFAYTPGVVFNVGLFSDCLFVRPAFGAYYFGDYFGPQYASIGFAPWFSLTIGGRPRFDPLFTYYNWHNSLADRNWLVHTQQHYDLLRTDAALRPPHTFAAQQQWLKNNPNARAGNMALAAPLREVAKDPSRSDFQFHAVSMADRQALALKGNELQQSAQQRLNVERNTNSSGGAGMGTPGSGGNNWNMSRNGMNGTNSNPSGAGSSETGTGTATSKFKLPTAAASNMQLSGNAQRGSSGSPQAGGAALNSTTGNNYSLGNRFGNNSSGMSNGSGSNASGPRFDSGDRLQANLQDKTNDASQNSNSDQSSARFKGPSLIQPGSGTSSNNVYSGNAYPGNASSGNKNFGNPNFGNGSNPNPSSSGNQSSPRMLLYPGAGGAGGNPNPSGGNGAGRGTGGGSGSGNKDDSNKKNKTSYSSPDFTAPQPHTNFQPAKPSLIDVQDVLHGERKAAHSSNTLGRDGQRSKTSANGGDSAIDDSSRRTSAGFDRGSKADAKDSAGGKSDATTNYQLPPLFRINIGNDLFRNPFLPGGGDAQSTPDNDSSHPADSTPGSNQPGSTPGSDHNLAGNGSEGTKSAGATTGIPQGAAAAARGNSGLTPTRNPGLAKYDYGTLVERGRSLSTPTTRTSYAPSLASNTASSDGGSSDSSPSPRELRDPISSIGPGSENHVMYGPLGSGASSMPMGPLESPHMPTPPMGSLGSAEDSDSLRGLGSYIPTNSLPTIQHFDLRLPRPTHAAPNADPSARTYDPVRGY